MNQENTPTNPGSILKFTYDDSNTIQNVDNNDIFSIFPNPTNGNLCVEIKEDFQKELKAELISLTGAKVKRFSNLNKGINNLDINSHNSGIYILRIYSESQSWQQKVVKL